MELNHAVAVATVRILAGILFLFQGYDKIFNIGISELKNTISSINKNRLPDGLIYGISAYTSWVELICGFLLILGFFKFFAIYLLCINIIIVALGFSMAKPMWENNLVFIRLVLLIFLLVTPGSWDLISFDHLFNISGLSQ